MDEETKRAVEAIDKVHDRFELALKELAISINEVKVTQATQDYKIQALAEMQTQLIEAQKSDDSLKSKAFGAMFVCALLWPLVADKVKKFFGL